MCAMGRKQTSAASVRNGWKADSVRHSVDPLHLEQVIGRTGALSPLMEPAADQPFQHGERPSAVEYQRVELLEIEFRTALRLSAQPADRHLADHIGRRLSRIHEITVDFGSRRAR